MFPKISSSFVPTSQVRRRRFSTQAHRYRVWRHWILVSGTTVPYWSIRHGGICGWRKQLCHNRRLASKGRMACQGMLTLNFVYGNITQWKGYSCSSPSMTICMQRGVFKKWLKIFVGKPAVVVTKCSRILRLLTQSLCYLPCTVDLLIISSRTAISASITSLSAFCTTQNIRFLYTYSCPGFTIDHNRYPVNIGISQTARFTIDTVPLMCLIGSFRISLSCSWQRTLCITYKERRDILRLTRMHGLLHAKCLLFGVIWTTVGIY